MDYSSNINTELHLERCKKIVKRSMDLEKITLTDEELTILTQEIMDTSLSMGGDLSDENIRRITIDYILSDFLPRFKKAHG